MPRNAQCLRPTGSTNVPSKNKHTGILVIGCYLGHGNLVLTISLLYGGIGPCRLGCIARCSCNLNRNRRSPLWGSVFFSPKVNPSDSCLRYSKVPEK